MRKHQSFSEVLRDALENAPESRYRISKLTGVSESLLCRFVQGERGLSLSNLDLLCQHLGLRLVKDTKKGK